MRSIRMFLLALVLLTTACKSSKPAQPAPQPPAPAPGSGVSLTTGGNANRSNEILGTAGTRQGNEVVMTTTGANLPPIGAGGTLYWIVDRPIPVFGQGVQLSLAEVSVKQVQPGSITLTIVSESGPIEVNGQRVNVFQPNQQVKLTY